MSVSSAVRSAIMRAIRVSEYGGVEKCKLVTDAAVPSPGSKQVTKVTQRAVLLASPFPSNTHPGMT